MEKYRWKNIDGKFTFLKNLFFKFSKIKKYFSDPEKKISKIIFQKIHFSKT